MQPRSIEGFETTADGSPSAPYRGIAASEVAILWKTALRLRHKNPEARDIIQATKTRIDEGVVAAIIEGALRLLPVDNTPSGTRIRQEMMRHKHDQALAAEKNVVEQVRARFPSIVDEDAQRETIQKAIEQGQMDVVRATPDILFPAPQHLCEDECRWIEYKNTFGFRKNPFVHSKHLKQYRRYRSIFGKGMVVYKLGYESRLFAIEGVQCVREDEFLKWINALHTDATAEVVVPHV